MKDDILSILFDAYPWGVNGIAIRQRLGKMPYIALMAIEKQGMIESEWLDNNGKPSPRYYKLTSQQWHKMREHGSTPRSQQNSGRGGMKKDELFCDDEGCEFYGTDHIHFNSNGLAEKDALLQSAYDVIEQALDDMGDAYSVCPAVKLWMRKWLAESGIKQESGTAPAMADLDKYDYAEKDAEIARLREVLGNLVDIKDEKPQGNPSHPMAMLDAWKKARKALEQPA